MVNSSSQLSFTDLLLQCVMWMCSGVFLWWFGWSFFSQNYCGETCHYVKVWGQMWNDFTRRAHVHFQGILTLISEFSTYTQSQKKSDWMGACFVHSVRWPGIVVSPKMGWKHNVKAARWVPAAGKSEFFDFEKLCQIFSFGKEISFSPEKTVNCCRKMKCPWPKQAI